MWLSCPQFGKCFAVSGGSWELREKATAGPKDSTFFWRMAARQPPGPLHCSISFSALLELQPVPGGGDPSLGFLPLTRHQHPCFWPCLALALRPFSACCTALRSPHSCRNCRCSCLPPFARAPSQSMTNSVSARLSMTCTFSEDGGRERGQPETSPRATHISAFEQAVQAGLQ